MDLTAGTAREIARHLGTDWQVEMGTVDTVRYIRHLVGPSDMRLYLSTTWGPKGMLHISGSYPDYIDRNSVRLETTSINVTFERGARAIAEEITRRLLPNYRQALAKALTAHIADKQYKEAKAKTRDEAAEILGAEIRPHSDYRLFSNGCFHVEVTGPDHCQLDRYITLTVDQLRRIKAAVPELFEAAKGGAA